MKWVASGYTAATSLVTGSSIWGNDGGGVQIVQDSNVAALTDGSGNAIYDNGNFGMGASDTWNQLSISDASLSVDWTGNYWGAAHFIPCSLGSQNGHLSYGSPDPQVAVQPFPVERGPLSRDLVVIYNGGYVWCGNDKLL